METVDLSTKTVLWIDNGLFIGFAQTCAPAFGRTLYWTPWQNSFPKTNAVLPGEGFADIERVIWLFDAVDQADLIVAPDVNFGDLQVHLESLGHRVWGARRGEIIELNRWKSKKILRDHGVMPSPAVQVYGMDDLREYLKEHENVWVKTSLFRGDFETFNSENYPHAEPKLDELENKLGAKKKAYEFIVEDNIEASLEWGIDAFTIDGQWPVRTLAGVEEKDLGYVGRVMEWTEIPEYLRAPNEKLSPWFESHRYRGWFSTELRIQENEKTFLIDPCARLPSPPNEVQQSVISNWPETLWWGAEGVMVEPVVAHTYGVIAMAHSSWADDHWQQLRFPESVRPWIKIRNHTRIVGEDYAVPQQVGLPEVAGVCGVGESLEEAIDHCKENAEQVKGYFIETKVAELEGLLEKVEEAKKLGIHI